MNKALWGKLGQFKWALVAVIVVLLIVIFATWRPVKYPATQAYVVGSGNCRGQVDTAQFLEKGDAFVIAADENGWAPTSGTAEAQEQAEFVTRFIDIYENSFQH